MIASLRGTLLEKNSDTVVIEAGGVGYAVTVTAAAQRALPGPGAEARLFIHTHAVQDSPLQLYGFAEPEERRMFETLLTVQGVGPKVAVAILSGLPMGDLVGAIRAADLATLTRIRGVGRKTAERMAVELREKVGILGTTGRDLSTVFPLPGLVPSGRRGEVFGALQALGYRANEFEAILSALDESKPTPDLIKEALAAMRRK
ncbi:MAG: Holliday junction branch migration protein RuvA [Polyangia bacterium]|jgi:Holliday junction DNA helicase RuvA